MYALRLLLTGTTDPSLLKKSINAPPPKKKYSCHENILCKLLCLDVTFHVLTVEEFFRRMYMPEFWEVITSSFYSLVFFHIPFPVQKTLHKLQHIYIKYECIFSWLKMVWAIKNSSYRILLCIESWCKRGNSIL